MGPHGRDQPRHASNRSEASILAHMLEAGLSRWRLRCRDLLLSDDIPLTHKFLGGMLGVRRTSVSIVANTLQQVGPIRYRRGHIRVLDVESLRDSSCELPPDAQIALGSTARFINRKMS
jgi:Crp-like helix-turn-helix domain